MATAGSVGAPEFVACVVGLSRDEGEDFTESDGIGKSCLCYRFFHSDSDEYADDHKSLLALHEFTSPVINSVHFLYWGSRVKSFSSSAKSAAKPTQVMFHVIEQTVFYQDETSKPFVNTTRQDSLDHYIRRITGSIESPGKLSYRSCNDIESQIEKQQYPQRLSRLPRGFMVLLDVSLSAEKFDSHLKRAEYVLDHLVRQKQKYVIVVTKRDNFDMDSLECAHKLKRKYHTHLIETSASRNLNVDDAFRVLACKTLQKKVHGLSDAVPNYEESVLPGEEASQKDNLKQVQLSPTTSSAASESRRNSRSIEKIKGWRRSRLFFGGKAENESVLANNAVIGDGENSLRHRKKSGNSPDGEECLSDDQAEALSQDITV